MGDVSQRRQDKLATGAVSIGIPEQHAGRRVEDKLRRRPDRQTGLAVFRCCQSVMGGKAVAGAGEDEMVEAAGEVADQVVAVRCRRLENKAVGAGSALQVIVAGQGAQGVVAAVAAENIGEGVAGAVDVVRALQ